MKSLIQLLDIYITVERLVLINKLDFIDLLFI